MAMWILRGGLVVSVALLPCAASAQGSAQGGDAAGGGGVQAVTLQELDVVATTPVGGTGGGGGQPVSKVPGNVETISRDEIAQDGPTGDATFTLARRTPGVNLSDSQGNPYRQSLTYRGFNASPVQGTPQQLAVYQNGTRINEAFGDVVNWDLIPPVAINRIDVFTNNPVFGLNALGGAVNIEMKNGFTWQGKELTVIGGSDGRIGGTFQYGETIGPWSFYVALDGLRDAGWRFQSPSELARGYADLGYRTPDAEFHIIAQGARNHFGAAAATPVELTRVDERAIFTYPQTSDTAMGQLQVTGKVSVSPSWDLQGNAYMRRFSQHYVDGNDTDVDECAATSSFRGALCASRDGFPRSLFPGLTRQQYLNQFRLAGPGGASIPYIDGTPYGSLDETFTESTGFGGSLQATNHDRILDHGNTFIVGGTIDTADYGFRSTSTLGYISPELQVLTNPAIPGIGFVPGIGTASIKTDGNIAIAPSRISGNNLYFGLYATDTVDVTDALAVTAGARLNFARITTQDLTGFSPDVTGQHTFNRINPVVGATYQILPELGVYGGYSESNRAPTPLELSCSDATRPCLLQASLVADPPLKQVVGRTYEAGIRGTVPHVYEDGRLSYKLGAYRSDISDDILQVAATLPSRGYFTNVPATRRQGIEVSGEYATSRLSLYANYALVDATFQFNGTLSSPNNPYAVLDTLNSPLVNKDTGTETIRKGNQMPLVPNHQFKAGFDVAVTPAWHVGMNIQAFSSSYFQGDEVNLNRKLPPYVTANLNTSYQVTETIQVFALVTNLFNNRYANFGSYFELPDQGERFANRFAFSDPRTTTLVQPLSAYGGIRMTW